MDFGNIDAASWRQAATGTSEGPSGFSYPMKPTTQASAPSYSDSKYSYRAPPQQQQQIASHPPSYSKPRAGFWGYCAGPAVVGTEEGNALIELQDEGSPMPHPHPYYHPQAHHAAPHTFAPHKSLDEESAALQRLLCGRSSSQGTASTAGLSSPSDATLSSYGSMSHCDAMHTDHDDCGGLSSPEETRLPSTTGFGSSAYSYQQTTATPTCGPSPSPSVSSTLPARHADPLLADWVVGERYQLQRIMGSGSYGEVAEAFDVVMQRKVSLPHQ